MSLTMNEYDPKFCDGHYCPKDCDGCPYREENRDNRNTEDERFILCKAIDTYGVDAQCKVAIEEMSELTKELCKYFRGADNADYIAEEVADVRIMLDQLCIMFGIELRAQRHRTEKMERLQRRLETE